MKRLVGMLTLAALACGESPDPGYLLTKARVVAALRAVEGDAARATPRPGETVDVQWQLIAPEVVEPTTYFLAACPPSDQAFGAPVCGGPPFQIEVQTTPQSEAPRIAITVPEDYAPETVVLLGAICAGGVVQTAIDPMSSIEELRPCVAEGVGQIVSASIAVEHTPEDRNLSPSIARLSLGETELTEEVLEARQPCAGGTLPQVALEEEITITLEAGAGSRERYVRRIEGAEPEEVVEDLQNSLFVTEGTLNRRFTFVDDDTPTPEVEFLAEAESDDPLPSEGRTVKLVVVMRDRRGGEAILRRGFCLVP